MMPVAFTLKTAPATEPITVAEAKRHFRGAVADTSEDVEIARFIAAGRAWVEEYTWRSLFTQTWQASMPACPAALRLPRATPLQSVTHVKYYDESNVLQTLSPTVYTLPAFHEPALLLLADGQSWPALARREDAFQVEYVTGADDVSKIPAPLVQAVALLTGFFYANREAALAGTISKEVEFAATALCAPFRRPWQEPVAA